MRTSIFIWEFVGPLISWSVRPSEKNSSVRTKLAPLTSTTATNAMRRIFIRSPIAFFIVKNWNILIIRYKNPFGCPDILPFVHQSLCPSYFCDGFFTIVSHLFILSIKSILFWPYFFVKNACTWLAEWHAAGLAAGLAAELAAGLAAWLAAGPAVWLRYRFKSIW